MGPRTRTLGLEIHRFSEACKGLKELQTKRPYAGYELVAFTRDQIVNSQPKWLIVEVHQKHAKNADGGKSVAIYSALNAHSAGELERAAQVIETSTTLYSATTGPLRAMTRRDRKHQRQNHAPAYQPLNEKT
ncbi:MAG: hypothetical protein LQ340_005343 [Diploschistes diacapsis]|nr:MAG: hypothetical protein LQ340_005343 [Diploschistes diacapsis]